MTFSDSSPNLTCTLNESNLTQPKDSNLTVYEIERKPIACVFNLTTFLKPTLNLCNFTKVRQPRHIILQCERILKYKSEEGKEVIC